MWTPLHIALGEVDSNLTYELFVRAVEQGVRETDDLDWKAILPEERSELRDEFSKDVAAMANTRGGLIVFGMSEERGTSAAREITPVDIGEPVQRKLRAIAASNIHPFVSGLAVVPIAAPGVESGLLVVLVPPSPDAPHVIGQHSRLGVPFRDGAETSWMREQDLERAYRERFDRQRDEQDRLRNAIADVRERLDLTANWIVGTAVRRTPLPALARRLPRDEIRPLFEEAIQAAHRLAPADGWNRAEIIRALNSGGVSDPKVGLRRWILQPPGSSEPDSTSRYVHIELHDDGAITVASQFDGWRGSPVAHKTCLPLGHVEALCADMLALIDTMGRRLGGLTRYGIRLDLVRRDVAEPVVIVDQMTAGGLRLNDLEVPPGTRQVASFRPVLAEVAVPSSDDDEPRAVARQLATDVVSQFGVGYLRLLHA